MMQSTDAWKGLNLAFSLRANFCRPTCWRVFREAEMCPVLMVIEQVSRHQPFEMPLIEDDRVVQQIVPAASHPAFSNTVLPRDSERPCELAGLRCSSQPKPHRLQILRLGRIARICGAVGRPMLLATAVRPKEQWHFASH